MGRLVALKLGVELANATPERFAAILQEDIARWARIVKESGATVD